MWQTSRGSNFNRIASLNTVAGNPSNAGWGIVGPQLELIDEELAELKEAIASRDPEKVRKELADLLVVAYGLGHRLGLPVDHDSVSVSISNFTKFDATFEDAQKTQEHYQSLGVSTYFYVAEVANEQIYVTKSKDHQTDVNGKVYPAHKFLKSVNYREAEFIPLPAESRLLDND